MARTLLIDGDVLAYRAAAKVETALEWEPGYWTWNANEDEAKARFLEDLTELMDTLGAQDRVIALSDDQVNFRKSVLPTYKGNRAKVKKPLVLKPIREWLLEEHGAWLRPTLEGDDILGILATHPKFVQGEKVIVSIDKDMKTIPGLFCRTTDMEIVEYSEAEADYWWMFQTLTGDVTDGYAGCPGAGPKKAEKILGELPGGPVDPEMTHVEWLWEQVVAAYEKAGLNATAALQQARVARILRAQDYDFKAKKPILWSPPD